MNCIYDANHSSAVLVNLLADRFPCFRDEATFNGRKVRFYKRAQILVADLWACFDGQSYGEFSDIEKITMFAGNDALFLFDLFLMTCLFLLFSFSFNSSANGYRLSHPSNTLSTGLSPLLTTTGITYPKSRNSSQRLELGN